MSGELLPVPASGGTRVGPFVGSTPYVRDNSIFAVNQSNIDQAVANGIARLPVAPVLSPTPFKYAPYVPNLGDFARLDASAGAFTQYLPASVTGAVFGAKKTDATANVITIQPQGTDLIDGLASVTLRLPNETRTYIGVPGGWVTAAGLNPITALDIRYPRTVNGIVPNVITGDIPIPLPTSASPTVQGLIKLGGHLSGTAEFPTVPGLAGKADLVGGLIPTSQIPSLTLTTSIPVASQAAMLALTTTQVKPGYLAIRSDGAGTFMLMAADPSVLANWTLLSAPTNAVVSVNGQIGTVNLSPGNVGAAAAADLTAEVTRAKAAEVSVATSAAGTATDLGTEVARARAAETLLATLLSPTPIKTTSYTAVARDLALMNVAGGATTLTLPTAPADRAQVGWRAIGATSAVPLVITAGAGDVIGVGALTTMSNFLADETSVLQYAATTKQWLVVSNYKTLLSLTPAALGITLTALGAAPVVHTHVVAWALEVLGFSGTRSTSATDVPDGTRVDSTRTLTQVYHRFGTADASGTTQIQSYKNGTLIPGSAVNITAPASSGGTGALSIALVVGDVITHQITALGTTPGARMSTQILGTQTCT